MGRAKVNTCFTVAYFAVISYKKVNEIGKIYCSLKDLCELVITDHITSAS